MLSLVTVGAPLDGDLRYEIGAQTTSPASPAGTFAHRPLMYRLILAALIRPADALGDGLVGFERNLLRCLIEKPGQLLVWDRSGSCSGASRPP